MSDKKDIFDNNDFEDIFSSSEKDDFEDVYSDSDNVTKGSSRKPQKSDEFEDLFTGRDDFSSSEPSEFDSFQNTDINAPRHREVNVNPEVKPYSYNYNKSANEKAQRISDERGFSDISSGKQPKEKKAKKKKHSGGKITAIVISAVLLFIVCFAGFGYLQAKKLIGKVNYSPLVANQYIDSSKLAHSDTVQNILLVGVDAREGEEADATRSDTMMILSIDNANKQMKLTSILRDTYVEIPGWKWNKINAAQSHGGRQLLVDTIEYNFKIDIDNYMLVNFDMFTTIIDELGGIDIDVTEKEANYINARYNMTQTELDAFSDAIITGQNHLTGAQALWYSRMRYLDSDFYRTERQRKVISAVISKAKKTGLTSLYGIAEKIMPMVETDLTEDQITSLGLHSLGYIKYDLVQMQIPIDGSWKSVKKSAGNVLSIDMDKNISALNTFVFQKAEVNVEETTTKKNK